MKQIKIIGNKVYVSGIHRELATIQYDLDLRAGIIKSFSVNYSASGDMDHETAKLVAEAIGTAAEQAKRLADKYTGRHYTESGVLSKEWEDAKYHPDNIEWLTNNVWHEKSKLHTSQ